MKISVVIVSYNGARTLPRSLQAMRSINLPKDVEFICVDNASDDETSDLFSNFLQDAPGRLVHEPRPGRSYALNAGLAVATGDLLIFTDDDVVPSKNWLLAYEQAAEAHPEDDVFAGQIRPDWPWPPPKWLEKMADIGLAWGATPIDRKEGHVTQHEVKGANIAVRRCCFVNGRQFRVELGVKADAPPGAGEETALCEELIHEGRTIRFLPNAALGHMVRDHQMPFRVLLERAVRNGRAHAIITMSEAPASRKTLFGLPGYMLAGVSKAIGSAMLNFIRGRGFIARKELMRAAFMWGQTLQIKEMHR